MSCATREYLAGFSVKGKQTATHTSFIGGIWLVPSEQRAELHRIMAADINKGIVMHVTERTPAVFKFFVDLDFEFGDAAAPMVAELENVVSSCVPKGGSAP